MLPNFDTSHSTFLDDLFQEEFISSQDWKEFHIPPNHIDKSYIYFLLSEEEQVLYIGQTTNLCQRMGTHLYSGVINGISKIRYFLTDKYHINEVEAALIIKYRPKYNLSVPSNKRYASIEGFRNSKSDLKGKFNKLKKAIIFLQIPSYNGYYTIDDLNKSYSLVIERRV